MTNTSKQYQKLLDENKELQTRLAQAETTLEAIRTGQVDMLFVSGEGHVQIYAAEESGRLYRVMLEAMPEGAAALTMDGLILFANQRLAELLGCSLERVQGAWLSQFLNTTDWMRFRHTLEHEPAAYNKLEASLILAGGGHMPVHLTFGIAQVHETSTVILVVSDQTEHQQLEQALRDSEALYRTLVESSEASIAVLDRNGVYLFANSKLADDLGRSPEDVAGMYIEDFFPLEAARQQLERVRAVLASQQGQVYESTSLVKGQPRLFRTSIQPILGASGRAILALFHAVDVTEAWQAKEEVAASAARYRSLFENTPVALLEWNITGFVEVVDRLRREGVSQALPYARQHPELFAQTLQIIRLEDANQEALVFFEARDKREILDNWQKIANPEIGDLFLASFQTLLESGTECSFEGVVLTLTGERKDMICRLEFEQRDQQHYLVAAITDISQRKQAERLLQAQSEQFRALAENSPDVITRFDQKYRLMYINRLMFNAQLGRPAAQVGDSLDTIGRSPEDIELRKRLIDQVFQTRETARLEFSFPGKDSLIWFDALFVPEFAPDASVSSVLVISRDISAIKKGELALQKLNRAQNMINECSSVLVHAQDEGQLLNEICRLIVESGGYRMAWVGLAENDPEQSVRPAAAWGFDDGYVESANISWADNERGRGPTGVTIREGVVQVNQNFATNPRMAPWREQALKRGYQSSLTLPLKNSQTTFGALSLYSSIPDAFDEDEAGLLQQLSDDLAFGLTALRERQALAHAQDIARRWEHIFEHAKWGVVVGSADERTLELMNPEFASMHGYSVEELTGKPIRDLFPPEEWDKLAESIRQAQEQGHYVYESLHLRKDGSIFPVVVDITAVKDENGQVLYRVANVRDISERKQAESALREREAKLSTLFRILPVGVSIIDDQRQMLEMNPALEKILRISYDGLRRGQHTLRQNLREDGTPMPPEEIPSSIAIREQREVQDVTLGVVLEDGATVWVNVSAAPLEGGGAVLVTSDISARKQSEALLRDREAKLSTLFSILPVGVSIIDDQRRILESNPALEKILSLSAEELRQGKNIQRRYLCEDGAPMPVEEFPSVIAIREQRQVQSVIMGMQNEDGSVVWLDISAAPLESRGAVVVVTDITARKQAEARTRFQANLLENVSDAIISTDMQLNVTSWNRVAEKLYGWRAEETLGKLLTPFIQNEYLGTSREGVTQAVQQNGLWRGEVIQHTRAGSLIYSLSTVSLLKDLAGSPTGFIAVNRDISERKRMEIALQQANQTLEEKVVERTAELQASEQRFKLALKNAPVTVAAQDKDLRFIWAYNQRTQDPASVLGKTDLDIFPPETAAALLPLKRRVLESGEELRQQLWVASGGRRLFLDLSIEPMRDAAGQISGIVLTTVDLTEFKLAEEALRDNERFFRLIATQTPDHLLVQDLELRYTTVINPQLGLTEAEMLGKTDYDILPNEEAEKLTRLKRRVLETGEPVQLVMPVTALNGELRTFDGSYLPKYDAEQRIDGLIGYFRDVTEQKRLEERLKQCQAELEQRAKE